MAIFDAGNAVSDFPNARQCLGICDYYFDLVASDFVTFACEWNTPPHKHMPFIHLKCMQRGKLRPERFLDSPPIDAPCGSFDSSQFPLCHGLVGRELAAAAAF